MAVDKAVLLPDETGAWAEEEDAQMRSLIRRKLGVESNPEHLV